MSWEKEVIYAVKTLRWSEIVGPGVVDALERAGQTQPSVPSLAGAAVSQAAAANTECALSLSTSPGA